MKQGCRAEIMENIDAGSIAILFYTRFQIRPAPKRHTVEEA
jgi:hypothetical protein